MASGFYGSYGFSVSFHYNRIIHDIIHRSDICMNNLSVIIITRNRLEKLKRCLDSLKSKLSEAEMIVVDNGSDDGTVEYLNSRQDIKLIALDSNEGVAGGRNAGLEQCSSHFIMFIDDDAWVRDMNFIKIRRYFISHTDPLQ